MKTNGILKLSGLGVIKTSGADAASFLNGQLSNNIIQMNEGELKLAAYCSPQGRILASFIVLKTGQEEFLMICATGILEETLKRLSMFIMRAKVQLSNANDALSLYGLIEPIGLNCPAPAPWTYKQESSDILIELPCVEKIQRHMIITSDTQNLPIKPDLSMNDWMWLYIRNGIAMVSAKTKGQFIPQMLNYESIGAIDFQKGCYPGQEVISRSQFRGTLKRRTYILHTQQEMHVGDEIYSVPKKGEESELQVLGNIIATVPNPNHGWDAMAVLRTEAKESKLTLTPSTPQSDEAAISILPLPYQLRDDF